jgi:hypothetical protein
MQSSDKETLVFSKHQYCSIWKTYLLLPATEYMRDVHEPSLSADNKCQRSVELSLRSFYGRSQHSFPFEVEWSAATLRVLVDSLDLRHMQRP